MMYLKIENENGVITFAPLSDDSIYVLCKHCGKMVKIENPGEIAWEVGSFQKLDICEECNDILLEVEEEKRLSEFVKNKIEALRAGGMLKIAYSK